MNKFVVLLLLCLLPVVASASVTINSKPIPDTTNTSYIAWAERLIGTYMDSTTVDTVQFSHFAYDVDTTLGSPALLQYITDHGGSGGSGSEDTLIFNDGSSEYSIVADRIKVKEGTGIDLQREDSTGYDVIRIVATVDSVGKALADAAGNVFTTTYLQTATAEATYETITNVGFIGDDTTNFKLAYDSVYSWSATNGAKADTSVGGAVAAYVANHSSGVWTSISVDSIDWEVNADIGLRIIRDTVNDTTVIEVPSGVLVIRGGGSGIPQFDSLAVPADGYIVFGTTQLTKEMADSLASYTASGLGAGGSGSEDSLYINDGSSQYSILNNNLKILEGSGLDIQREDSTSYDVFRFVVTIDSVGKALSDASGNTITSTYATITNVDKIADDTTNWNTVFTDYSDGFEDGKVANNITVDLATAAINDSSGSDIYTKYLAIADVGPFIDTTTTDTIAHAFIAIYDSSGASIYDTYLPSSTAASTYETVTNVGKIGDDTATWKAVAAAFDTNYAQITATVAIIAGQTIDGDEDIISETELDAWLVPITDDTSNWILAYDSIISWRTNGAPLDTTNTAFTTYWSNNFSAADGLWDTTSSKAIIQYAFSTDTSVVITSGTEITTVTSGTNDTLKLEAPYIVLNATAAGNPTFSFGGGRVLDSVMWYDSLLVMVDASRFMQFELPIVYSRYLAPSDSLFLTHPFMDTTTFYDGFLYANGTYEGSDVDYVLVGGSVPFNISAETLYVSYRTTDASAANVAIDSLYLIVNGAKVDSADVALASLTTATHKWFLNSRSISTGDDIRVQLKSYLDQDESIVTVKSVKIGGVY